MEPGYCTKVDVVRVIDGDTIEFEIRRRFHLRLRDIDVPESKTEHGKKATEFVQKRLFDAEDIKIFIPTGDPLKLMDINSFERLVGDVEVDGKNLAELLRKNEYNK